MTGKEIELAMEGLFRGASKVRARKYAKKFSSNLIVSLKAKDSFSQFKDFGIDGRVVCKPFAYENS